jgi:hypothetical protein
MAFGARQPALRGPTAVSIHDDGDVLRTRALISVGQSLFTQSHFEHP